MTSPSKTSKTEHYQPPPARPVIIRLVISRLMASLFSFHTAWFVVALQLSLSIAALGAEYEGKLEGAVEVWQDDNKPPKADAHIMNLADLTIHWQIAD